MNKIFNKIGKLFENKPFKSIFVALIVFVIMITGALNIKMSTGSETLVQTDNDAYINNYNMENEFGGEAIMVLFEGSTDKLLSLDNLTKLWNIEQKLQYNEDIFTIMSPASVVHQITDKQISEIKKQIPNMSEGLSEMGNLLQKIGSEIGSKELPNPDLLDKKIENLKSKMNPNLLLGDIEESQNELFSKFSQMSIGLDKMGFQLSIIGKELGNKDIPNPKDFEEKFDELSNVTKMFDDLIEGQNNLTTGITNIRNSLSNSSNGLSEVSNQLNTLANLIDDPTLKTQLTTISGKINESATGLGMMSKNTGQLSEGTNNTALALGNIGTKLNQELQTIKDSLTSGGLDPEELKTMAQGFVMMGENLTQMSSGMANIDLNDILPDLSTIFDELISSIDKEMGEMKSMFNDGLSPDELSTMSDGFIMMGENLSKLSEGLEMFSDKSEMVIANFPHNKKELENILYEEDLQLRSIFDETVIDDSHIMMMIKLNGNLDDTIIDNIYEDVLNVVESENVNVDYIISGKPVLDSSLRVEMKSNMITMVISAVALMFIILSLVFKVRWRILSLGIIFISVIATLGLMGHLSISMTMVSMAVFPILIGLGIDYSIQFHNRYEEEKSVAVTLVQIGKAVGLAVLATVLGFISLYASPVPMIQDFGKMLTVGVVVSFVGSLFLLMPILKARDLVNDKDINNLSNNKETFIERFLSGLGKVVTKLSPLIIVVSIGLAGAGLVADQKVGVETDIETFMPQDMNALHDIHYVRDVVGSTNQMILYIEDENILGESNLKTIENLVENVESKFSNQIVDIKSLDNLVSNMADTSELSHAEYLDIVEEIPLSQRKMFINEDNNKSVIIMNVEHMATEELQDFVVGINEIIKDYPLDISIAGKSVLDVEMVKGLTDGRLKMTVIGLALVFIALLVLYRSFFKSIVAVLPVVLIVGMSGGVMYMLGLNYTPITATLGALVLGMGTEMTIMLLERYLEERNLGNNKAEAIDITMRNIGKATLASGLTTIGGFSVLMTSKFEILKDFGLMTVINISLALISTFVILPSLIWIFDKFLVKEKKSSKELKRFSLKEKKLQEELI